MSDRPLPPAPPPEAAAGTKTPAVVAPVPERLFGRRSARFRALAPDHPMRDYLIFLADLSQAQHDILAALPDPTRPAEEIVGRAQQFDMPAVAREQLAVDACIRRTLDALFDAATDLAMPDAARAALSRVRLADEATLAAAAGNVMAVSVPVESVAEHVFVGAALQVHLARVAAALDAGRFHAIGDGACPVCGGPPATSAVVTWAEADKVRYALCGLCATRWNVVRVKCLACSSTKGIHYKSIEGLSTSIRAECCDTCRSYVKIMSESEDPGLDGIADDVASLGLDMLVREEGHRRAGFDLYLLGH